MTAPLPTSDRLESWVREHAPAVRGYVLGMVRRAELADDLAQETFRRALAADQRYEERGQARAYLLRIADRLVCDWARRNQREITLDDDAWAVVAPATRDDDPTRLAQQAEWRHGLAAALERLTPGQRRVLLLRYYGDLEFADIAAATGMPLGTVLSHCHRGLAALRNHLSTFAP